MVKVKGRFAPQHQQAAQAQAAQAQAAQAAQAQAEAHARAQAEAQARAWAQAQAQAQAQSTPEGAFKVSMPRAQGDKLGLLLVNRNQTAVIKAVKPGVVAQWNARNPNLQVEPGQRVLEA